MINKRIFLDGAIILLNNLNIDVPLIIDIKHDSPFIKLHFELKGKSVYTPNNKNDISIKLKEGQYNFFYLPKVEGTLTWDTGERKSIEIDCSKEFIKKLFRNDFLKVSGAFGMAIEKGNSFKMWNDGANIPDFLLDILHSIVEHSQKKEVDLLYLENQIIKMLLYLFAEINSKYEISPQLYLNQIEQQQIIKAEKILLKNIQTSITVEELALKIGINRHKLNRNFKQIYGEPVFQYLTRLRMEKAKTILSEKSMNISEVAYEVGYKNPQHFTVAFKKFFGYVPSKLK